MLYLSVNIIPFFLSRPLLNPSNLDDRFAAVDANFLMRGISAAANFVKPNRIDRPLIATGLPLFQYLLNFI